MARSGKRKAGAGVTVKQEAAGSSSGSGKQKKAAKRKICQLDESEKEKIDSFRMVTRTDEKEALKWLSSSGWASGTALQDYFKFMQKSVTDTVDLTLDEPPVASNTSTGSTGGLGEILFNSHYGRFLNHINRIDFAAKSDLTLPRVVVIGNESSGKSSTLERIAMFPFFPRDRDLCTRMPIKLCLRNDDTADPSKIKVKHTSQGEQIVQVSDAAECISSLMKKIVMEKHGGKLTGIVDEELVVEVRNSRVPTLDLIDLPGIVAASISGEPTDMMNTTRNLVRKYIGDQDTLVVAVIPANSRRIRDSQALQLVQECSAQSRTIGVLTMPDLAYDPRRKGDPYWELKERLDGKAEDIVELEQGYVAVKNRDTLDENEMKILGVGADEAKWFNKNLEEFDPATQVGVGALLHKMDALINSHIRTRWVPRIRQHIANRKTHNAEQLKQLGLEPQQMSTSDLFSRLQSMPFGKKAMLTAAAGDLNTFRSQLLESVRESSKALLNDLKSRLRIILEKNFNDSSLPVKLSRFAVFKEAVIGCILQEVSAAEEQFCDSLTKRTELVYDTSVCTNITAFQVHIAECLAEVIVCARKVVDLAPTDISSQLQLCAVAPPEEEEKEGEERRSPSRKRKKGERDGSLSIFLREDRESAEARTRCKRLEASLVATQAVLDDIADTAIQVK